MKFEKCGILSPSGEYFAKRNLSKALSSKIYSLQTNSKDMDVDHLFLVGYEGLDWYSKQIEKKFKTVAVIFSDSLCAKKHEWCNMYTSKHNIPVYAMPDLDNFLKNYVPAYQIIEIPKIEINKPNDKILIYHSPQGRKLRQNLKGSKQIIDAVNQLKRLYDIELIVVNKVPWAECVRKVSNAHIFIDQLIYKNPFIDQNRWGGELKYNGGIGQSGLEAMKMKCCVITSGKIPKTDKYFPPPPVLFTDFERFKDDLEWLLLHEKERKSIAKEQYKWANIFSSPEFVVKNITRHIKG
jgi:hypothetical protein